MPRPSGSVVTKTGDYVATLLDETILCDGTLTITLPTAVGIIGTQFIIKNIGTGLVTIATTSSQTIDGDTTWYIADRYTSLSIVSNGTNWSLI